MEKVMMLLSCLLTLSAQIEVPESADVLRFTTHYSPLTTHQAQIEVPDSADFPRFTAHHSPLTTHQAQIEVPDSADFPRKLQLRAITATVRVHNPTGKSEGSGVIVRQQGPFVYILTAHHLVKDAPDVEIALFSEKAYPKAEKAYRSVKVVAKTADIRDLALIRLVTDDKMAAVLPLCPRSEVPKGDSFPALALGCPEGQAPTALVNKVVAKKKIKLKDGGESAYFWECSDAVIKGRSGGPLIDKRGYVVGICSGTSDGKGYFTHPDEIHGFLKQHGFEWLTEKDGQ